VGQVGLVKIGIIFAGENGTMPALHSWLVFKRRGVVYIGGVFASSGRLFGVAHR